MPHEHQVEHLHVRIDPLEVHLRDEQTSVIVALLKAIDAKLDGIIDSAGDKEKMVALAQDIAAKRAALKGAVDAVPQPK